MIALAETIDYQDKKMDNPTIIFMAHSFRIVICLSNYLNV